MLSSTPTISLASNTLVLPYITVSPIGLSTTGVTRANNGADYGPDTSGTTTCGIQEALNSLPSCMVNQKSLSNAYTVSGQYGELRLFRSIYNSSSLITIPAGTIKITGVGMSSWIPPNNIGLTQDLGGTVIACTSFTTGGMKVPKDLNGNPATMLTMRDLEIRMQSPSSAQTTNTPAVLDLGGFKSGEVSNMNVIEAPTTPGVVGYNLYKIIDFSAGGSKDTTEMRNVRGFGGNIAITLAAAHITAIGVTGGQTGSSITSNSRGLDIKQNLGCYFANLHAFSCKYGLSVTTYNGRPYTPLVIYGIMFEAVTHYMLNGVANMTGTIILEGPCWNQPSLDPTIDIPATMPSTTNVITKYEQDETGSNYSDKHVTVATSSATAGASPYTFVALPYDQVFVITTVGGMTALTLDGQALYNGSFSVGQQIYVGAGHILIATWATTAPVFQILPQ